MVLSDYADNIERLNGRARKKCFACVVELTIYPGRAQDVLNKDLSNYLHELSTSG